MAVIDPKTMPTVPPPEVPLVYPIVFANAATCDEAADEEAIVPRRDTDAAQGASSLNAHTVTLFNALHWLYPVYELAQWLPRRARCTGPGGVTYSQGDETVPYDDVRAARELLPLFDRFFAVQSKIIPKHEKLYYLVESLTLPTPKGPKTITRSKVEGDARASYAQPVRAGAVGGLGRATVTNSSAYFSLLPGHNHFLNYYEDAKKLGYFTYVQLDKLRFAWVAVRELIDENKVYHLADGSITGFAARDLRKNNLDALYMCHSEGAAGRGKAAVSTTAAPPQAEASNSSAGGRGAGVVGRGGGNARLHQGTSGNVIVGPSREALQSRKDMAQKRFMKEQLAQECQRRWPHTPPNKSCIFVIEDKFEAELPPEALQQLCLPNANMHNRNKTARRGPHYYLATIELPLLNKKGTPARFRAPRWWNNRADAENAAAEVALMALHQYKSA